VFGKNTGGSVDYIKIGISNGINEIPEMKKTIWMGIGSNDILHVGLLINFF
jgi:hypothetical protein